MIVGTLELSLRMDGCFSLKDKRRILRSLLERSRRRHCVAIAEVADQDLWNAAVIGVSCVSTDTAHAESILQAVLDLFDATPDIAVESAVKDIGIR